MKPVALIQGVQFNHVSDAHFKACLKDGAYEGVPENFSPQFLQQVSDTGKLVAAYPHQYKHQKYKNNSCENNQVQKGAINHVRAVEARLNRLVAQHFSNIETSIGLVSIANLLA